MKDEILLYLCKEFEFNGKFTFKQESKLKSIIKENKVPEYPGIYLIVYNDKLLYVGKAGTIKNDGTTKNQKLNKRISAKQEGLTREEYFKKKLAETTIPYIDFYWFVTLDQAHNKIPSFIELKVIQMYYEKYNRLPEWNKCV